jgi:hypothetical protein
MFGSNVVTGARLMNTSTFMQCIMKAMDYKVMHQIHQEHRCRYSRSPPKWIQIDEEEIYSTMFCGKLLMFFILFGAGNDSTYSRRIM